MFIHTSNCVTVSIFAAVCNTAYRRSKTTLRVLRTLFFIYSPNPCASTRWGEYMKKQPYGYRKVAFSLVPAVGLEPTRMISPQDFESSASASFTTPAQVLIYHSFLSLATIFVNLSCIFRNLMLELRIVEVVIEAALRKELLVSAFFDYVAFVHNKYQIGVFNR